MFAPSEPSRFGVVQTTEDISRKLVERIPVNTRKQTSWAVSLFNEWAEWRNKQGNTMLDPLFPILDLGKMDNAKLNHWLARFITEIRRKDGSPYPPNTLYQIAAGIQRHLRDTCGLTDIKFFQKDDPHFSIFRGCLDHRMKELTGQGIGIHAQQADPVSNADEELLWSFCGPLMTAVQRASCLVYFSITVGSLASAEVMNIEIYVLSSTSSKQNLMVRRCCVLKDVHQKMFKEDCFREKCAPNTLSSIPSPTIPAVWFICSRNIWP